MHTYSVLFDMVVARLFAYLTTKTIVMFTVDSRGGSREGLFIHNHNVCMCMCTYTDDLHASPYTQLIILIFS